MVNVSGKFAWKKDGYQKYRRVGRRNSYFRARIRENGCQITYGEDRTTGTYRNRYFFPRKEERINSLEALS